MNKYPYLLLIVLIPLFIMVGCTNENSSSNSSSNPVNIKQISTNNTYDQSYSNKAKQFLSQKENITKVVAANTDKLLIIAIEVPHHERFGLQKINKQLSKEIDQKFKDNDLKVELVTDKKIIIELEKIEKKLQNNSLNKKELEKELKHISKLLKEQT